ncbi:hypothetical protein [Pedobacter caeni]|uniref:Uncharacterized protein n=1 Tax=Pedobacter caeni TaxID=288992 RepID=A0A1M5KY47_9SPHI|nr:hypothetical protein [Pedobacter caeni]SHG57590.1 hypothetical protein SAMN04488522_106134 [Pedobacter caeni]
MNKSILLLALLSLTLSLMQCSRKSVGPSTVPTVVEVADPAGAPPKTWKEHWFDHTQLLTRVFYDDDLAVYYDGDVDKSITWPFKYIGDVWRYTRKIYGGHGSDPRLYAVFHTNKYSGGHPDYYFSAGHDFRNVIDCGPGPWLTQAGNIDVPTHEVFHIVESATFNTKGSAGFGAYPNGIWGDSKFSEIYQYDVYLGLGMPAEAQRWYDKVLNGKENFPAPNSYWFKDWLFPWYNNYGKTRVIVDFFKLLAENFPKDANHKYTRKMNWGEYIHFSSGAARADLKAMATTAFGWKTQWENELLKARLDFPDVTY